MFSKDQPWVRSIQWNATRVLVHACLRQFYGDDLSQAECQYKLLMLHFLSWLLERACKDTPKLVVLQMAQKLALRGQKLRTRWPDLAPGTHPTLTFSLEVCQTVRSQLDSLWKKVQESHAKTVKIAPVHKLLGAEFVQNTRHPFRPPFVLLATPHQHRYQISG